ncbi:MULTISPECIES: hypothetical protein [Cupriavidus]|uniref:hypothetical protein n=1 Tax=Cupriavidus sp. DF5525 TaxID=3160989 RepID=UPI0003B0FB50|nr:hypothetical protein N234_23680 [Ralstonia pickettii DTP0602]
MRHQAPRREPPNMREVPPAKQSPERQERSTPMHDEGPGKLPRQPGQIDIGRLPPSSMQQ